MSVLTTQLKKANQCFKSCKYQEAINKFSSLITEILSREDTKSDNNEEETEDTILFDVLCNRSACYSLMFEYELAAVDAMKCVELSRKSVKAYARLATAYAGQQDFNNAISECDKGLSLNSADMTLKSIKRDALKQLGKEDTGITVSGEVHSPVVNYIARAQEAGGGHDHSHGHGHGHGHSHQHGGHDRGDGCDHHDHNHSHATAHCVHKATPASKATCFNGLSAVFRGKSESKNENHGFTFCCLV